MVSSEHGHGLEVVSLMRKLCSRSGTKRVTQKNVEEVILKGTGLAKK